MPIRKHHYEAVVDDEVNYNRLQRSASKSRKLSASASGLSGMVSVTPPIVPRRSVEAIVTSSPSIATPHPQQSGDEGGECVIFDNPDYDDVVVVSPPTRQSQHVDIYKSDSSCGDEIPAPKSDSRAAGCGHADSNDKNDEYFTDSSIFLVNGLVEDETRRAAPLPDPRLPSNHYTPLLQPDKPASDYNVPIISTDSKYVSERGHLYHVLEKDERGRGLRIGGGDRERAVMAYSVHEGREMELVISNSDASSSSMDERRQLDASNDSSGSDGSKPEGVAYHTLVHTPSNDPSRETSPGTYDVIDRSMRNPAGGSKASLKSLGAAYSMIDRGAGGKGSVRPGSLPTAQYDTIECTDDERREEVPNTNEQ